MNELYNPAVVKSRKEFLKRILNELGLNGLDTAIALEEIAIEIRVSTAGSGGAI